MLFKSKNKVDIKLNVKTHPLTLDQRWHALFSNSKTRKMKSLEDELNKLLKTQGQYHNDFKEYSQLKRKIMTDILESMPEAFEEEKNPSLDNMDKNKKYIEEINSKLDHIEEALINLPKEIDTVNGELLQLSMSLCYERMLKNKELLNDMDKRISILRDQLKELAVKKMESKEEYDKLYAYMHDMVGPNVIEQFDQVYLGGKNFD